MRIKIILLLVGLVAASSVGLTLYYRWEQPQVEVKTMDYYLAHDEEREAVCKDCENRGVSTTADTPEARNCRAALNARQKKIHEQAVSGKNLYRSETKSW
jgi:hypothetical protein